MTIDFKFETFFQSGKIKIVRYMLTIVKQHANDAKRSATTACLFMFSLNTIHFKTELYTSESEQCCVVNADHTNQRLP